MNLAYLKTESFYQIFNLSGKDHLLDQFMIFAAKYLVFIIILLIILLAVRAGIKEKKAVIITLLSLGIAFTINKLLSVFYFTPRPFVAEQIKPLINHASDASFPSSHTTFVFVIAFSYLFYKSKYTLIFILAAFWVAFARIYVGVHYLLDIFGGILVGLLSVIFSWQIKKFVRRYLV